MDTFPSLQNKSILLCVTGGIAAYKAAELLRLLRKTGAQVQVAMTRSATRFVAPLTFQALSGQPVMLEQLPQHNENIPENGMSHITLSRQSDLLLVAPASANFLARIAHGFADDLVSTAVLARDCPLIVAPAMNRQMWENPTTQRNIAQLKEDGIEVIGPGCGEQACGETGEGRMFEPADILQEVIASFTPDLLAGKQVLLTAGATFEPIDPVRGISNISSGRMGYAMARAARLAGARVTLVSGPTALPHPAGVETIAVHRALEMHEEVMKRAAVSDIFIAVAAVADYRVTNASAIKIKKNGGPPSIELAENPDILATVAALPKPPFCVGFAAESEKLAEHAKEKLLRKKVSLIVGNLVQEAMGQTSSSVTLFDANGSHDLPRASKEEQATRIVKHIANLLAAT